MHDVIARVSSKVFNEKYSLVVYIALFSLYALFLSTESDRAAVTLLTLFYAVFLLHAHFTRGLPRLPTIFLSLLPLFIGVAVAFVPLIDYRVPGHTYLLFFIFLSSLYYLILSVNRNFIYTHRVSYILAVICVVMAIAILLISNDYLGKYMSIKAYAWSKKYHAFWLLMLLWGVLALLPSHGLRWVGVKGVLLAVVGYAIVMDYSDSAKLAYVLGMAVWVFSRYSSSVYIRFLQYFVALYILTIPFVWNLFLEGYQPLCECLGFRCVIYSKISQVIVENPLWGLGTNAFYEIQSAAMSKHHITHPHNFALQVWLEFGAFGALLLTGAWLVFVRCLKRSGLFSVPEMNALILTLLIISSFSFNIWSLDLLYLLSMGYVLMKMVSVARRSGPQE